MCGEVSAHLAATTMGFVGYIIIGIYPREELLGGILTYGQHESLVTIVATTEISFLESPCHSQLRHFLSISKDTKLSLACKDFLTPQETTFAAEHRYSIILQGLSFQLVKRHTL